VKILNYLMQFLTLTKIRGGHAVSKFELYNIEQPSGWAKIYGNYHMVPQRLRS